ncbi:MAG TPA: serpin family protein [Pseudonocardiaceae bacterium]
MNLSRVGLVAGSVFGIAVLVACGGAAPQATVQPLPKVATLDAAEVSAAVGADDAVGIDLLAAEAAQNQGNLALSPASVAIALQMVATGADGDTATQIAHVLHLPDVAAAGPAGQAATAGIAADARPGSVTLHTANTLWTQQGKPLLPGFTQGLASHFGTTEHTANFAGDAESARQDINQLVATQTEGKIAALFPPGTISDTTTTVLTNALYLAAAWQNPFHPDATAPAAFTTGTGASTTVPTMTGELTANYASRPGYQLITVPYVGGKLGFSILLPAPGSNTDALLSAVRGTGLVSALAAAKPTELTLSMPKFTVKSTMDLSGVLAALGMPTAFTQQADFDRISTQHLFIQNVEHDTYVQLDENGTVAAAATGVAMGMSAIAASPSIHVQVNRPFLFAITDLGTGLPLFVGRLTNPA